MSELAAAIEALNNFVPELSVQADAKVKMLEFLTEHDDALHRSCLEGHLTSSALVVNHAGNRALFMLHAKAKKWFQPGGHADGMPDMAEVALKEAREETGISGLIVEAGPIDLDVHGVHFEGEQAHLHLDFRYLIRAPKGAMEVGNEESLALAWHDLEGLAGLGVDDSTMRVARIGLALANAPVA